MFSLSTFRRTITVTALALAVGAVVVPSAAANGDDGDRATSKPIIVASAPEGLGSLGDRGTSKSPYGSVDTWYQYAASATKAAQVSAPEGFGSMGDRATSKPIIDKASGLEVLGSLGDRATSKSPYGPVDTWYQYAVSSGNSTPVSATPTVTVVTSDGFSWTDFAIGAAAMFGTFALLAALGVGFRGTRAGHTLRST